MEKSRSMSINTNSLEEHNNGGRSAKISGMMMMNESKDNCSWGKVTEEDVLGDAGGDLLGGFSWPPRSYTCTFCKREFRSAQALGGHMNVHRRDRARLRQMPTTSSRDLHHPHNCSSNYSLFNLNRDPNPNSKPNPNNANYSPYCFSNHVSTSASRMLPPLISSSSTSSPQPNFPCVSHSSATHPSYHLLPRGYQKLTMMKSQIPPYGVCKYDSSDPNENQGKSIKKSEIVRLNLEIGLLGDSKSDDLDLELRLGCS